jgi:hypothetical protein
MAFGDPNYVMLFKSRSRIGTIFPDCTLEESHDDRVQITSHPVEKGANISDHAFLLPKTVEMRVGWSDSSGKNDMWAQNKYEEILRLQAKLEPIDVTTGKRLYKNMMITGISVTNDQTTKSAVLAVVRMSEIRFASVLTNVSVNRVNMLFPQSTASPENVGAVQPAQRTIANNPPPAGQPPDSSTSVLPPSSPAL